MNPKKRISISLSALSVFVTFSFLTYNSFDLHRWTQPNIIEYDVSSYYSYLPAAFIYHDFSFKYIDSLPQDIKSKLWYSEINNGLRVQKMTMGIAFFWSPFFGIANKYYWLKNRYDTGYGKSYQHAIAMAALFYILIGLIYLRKTLLKLFNEYVAAIVIILISIGTNLYNYVIYDFGMSHVYSFCLISLFVWFSIKWNENINSVKYLILLFFMGGLITLIRPINILIFLLPIFYDLNSNALSKKIQWAKKKYYLIPVLILSFIIPIIPQLLYWHYCTGNYFYYSYGDERFYFLHPHILEGLFGFRKGLFAYTPFMLLIFPGFYYSFTKKISFAWIILFILSVFIYVTFSWWCWWYGGSFGARSVVDFYPLFCLPIGVFVNEIINRSLFFKLVFLLLLVFFVWLNLFQTRQYENTLLHYDSMNLKTYLKIFGTNQWPENYDQLVQHPDYLKARKGEE